MQASGPRPLWSHGVHGSRSNAIPKQPASAGRFVRPAVLIGFVSKGGFAKKGRAPQKLARMTAWANPPKALSLRRCRGSRHLGLNGCLSQATIAHSSSLGLARRRGCFRRRTQRLTRRKDGWHCWHRRFQLSLRRHELSLVPRPSARQILAAGVKRPDANGFRILEVS
jgi:hypothetical protein